MDVASELLPQAFPELQDGHAGVEHQVEREGPAEGADADPKVPGHLGGAHGQVLSGIGVPTFLDVESQTAAVARVCPIRACLLTHHLLHIQVQLVDLLPCGLDHTQHGKAYNLVWMEAVEPQGTPGELLAQEGGGLLSGLFPKRSSNVF